MVTCVQRFSSHALEVTSCRLKPHGPCRVLLMQLRYRMLRTGFVRTVKSLQLLASHQPYVAVAASQFEHILSDDDHTSQAYAGDPLAALGCHNRGRLLEMLARRMLEKLHPDHLTQDANSQPLGRRINGARRSVYQAEWDWVLMGRRAELKTSQLSFDSWRRCWRVAFLAVKLSREGNGTKQPFDDLYVMIYAPNGFYLFKHDLETAVSTTGARTQNHGHEIRVNGRRGQCWQQALQTISYRLAVRGGCELISHVEKSDKLALALYSQLSQKALDAATQAYENVPMSTMNAMVRGKKIQQIAFELDQSQHPESCFAIARGEISSLGRRRGESNAAVDWIRDGVRVEVKSSKLRYCASSQSWTCAFSNIKVGLSEDGSNAYFDELWLAIYSPSGIDVYKHWNFQARLQHTGKAETACGRTIKVTAKKGDWCPSRALELVKAQLEEQGAEHHFAVLWAAG